MTFKIVKTQRRDTVDIPFFFEKHPLTDEYRKFFYTTYMLTKKCLSLETVYSDDKLSVTKTSTWDCQQSFQEYLSDEYNQNEVLLKSVEYDIQHSICNDVEYIIG